MKNLGGAIPQVPLEWYKHQILPPLPAGLDIPALLDALRANGKIANGGYWSKFSELPSSSRETEDVVFKPFEEIAEAVGLAARSALPARTQRVEFRCSSNKVHLSTMRRNTSNLDGFGLYTGHYSYRVDGPVFWEAIVAPGEKKKESNWEVVNDVRNSLRHPWFGY